MIVIQNCNFIGSLMASMGLHCAIGNGMSAQQKMRYA